MHNKICLVYPWFGCFNSYFGLWLESAKNNKTIDFLIYTDKKNIRFIADNFLLDTNIKVFESSLAIISEKISNLAGGARIKLTNPYKLCDYKPLYCYIFNEIEQYKYWGFGDMDVILGDISEFINLNALSKNDVIGHAGHMQIFKNTNIINSLIFKTPKEEFKKVLSDTNNNYFFDERHYSRFNLYDSERKMMLSNFYADVRPASRKFGAKYFNFSFRGLENKAAKSYFYYDRNVGKLYCVYFKNKTLYKYEILYVHLQKRKMKNFVNNKDVNYLIVPNRFVECSANSRIHKYTRFHIIDFFQCEWANRKSYLHHLVNRFKCKK